MAIVRWDEVVREGTADDVLLLILIVVVRGGRYGTAREIMRYRVCTMGWDGTGGYCCCTTVSHHSL